MTVNVVWFKRDLRVTDHWPLVEAAARGPCVCLYIYEPSVLTSSEFDASHLDFINESLRNLADELKELGGALTVRRGEAVEVLKDLHAERGIETLWSHEETGTNLTFTRDKAVGAWARQENIHWVEIAQHGVVRRLKTRDGWSKKWQHFVNARLAPRPTSIDSPSGLPSAGVLSASDLGLPPSTRSAVQTGGSRMARKVMDSFLEARGEGYQSAMSSPVSAWDGCSRISAHLAWGNISIRTVYQLTRRRVDALQAAREVTQVSSGAWLKSLRSFEERLRWHCHFIQKLEDQPSLEFSNLSRAYDGIREEDFSTERFSAWCEGQTGFPLVDACMRALHATGWINFRMRAMLMSFASYQLWLDWRPTANYLQRLFLDFEPGIHFSQSQMQSGVTGINTFRIYSPIKQVLDQDPSGVFIREYCPELEAVPDSYIAEPHKMPPMLQQQIGCVIGKHYPLPIVEHGPAYSAAKKKMFAVKRTASARSEAQQVFRRHGSRRRPRSRDMFASS